ncbi:MAG: MBL fold metallo-hydrolase [Acidimicrobiia bacterium]|nr:MBL fold metallo-hydrolase [Acidimicrobiia bacterium]
MLWKTAVGGATLYAIEDGYSMRDPHEFFLGSTPDAWIGHEDELHDGRIRTSFGCFLVDDGDRLTMVDAGFGVNAPDDVPHGEGGWMPAALESLGVDPADVTDVVFTHLHPDHILGALDADRSSPFFPNAAFRTLRRELDHWRSDDGPLGSTIAPVVDTLDDAGTLAVVEEPGTVLPGISMVETFGHTPGHTSILVAFGEDAVMISGDVLHSPMQIVHTDWNIPFDVDKPKAAASRKRLFEDLAASGTPLAGGHLDRPGFGRIVSRDDVLAFQPLAPTIID